MFENFSHLIAAASGLVVGLTILLTALIKVIKPIKREIDRLEQLEKQETELCSCQQKSNDALREDIRVIVRCLWACLLALEKLEGNERISKLLDELREHSMESIGDRYIKRGD